MKHDLQTLKPKRGRPAGAVQRLTVQEVATLLSKPVQTIYTWTKQKTVQGKPVLPVQRLGRAVRILMTDVEALEERLAMRAPNAAAVEHFERVSAARKLRRASPMVSAAGNFVAMGAGDSEMGRDGVQVNGSGCETDLQSVIRPAVSLGKTGLEHSARRNTGVAGGNGTGAPQVANRGGGESLVTRPGYIHIHSSAQNFIPMEGHAPS